ncbi:peptidoglycan bridge formation glycyltransferase FemA/FemB family protein [Candidatus Saccharibacteria bacterium]|nr:peptidoglycan bridge formation glycyltransferase FemA/FemB family protein [Candidatus Saccharibacteria bacterium]MBQ9017351.1 peptidoglycan bridge formation glycyltransferase FemA/FemB family protein [Candidatus Saccharibacteria bacterium]
MHEGPKLPLQQTEAWQKLQQDLNQTTFFLSNNSDTIAPRETNYQMLVLKKSTPAGPYFYLPYGPYLRQKSAAKPAYEALQALIKRERVIFTRIEPQNAEIASYWLKTAKKSKDLSPKETWILDLEPDLNDLYKNMKQNTRNLAKNYPKKGLEVKIVEKTRKNLDFFYSLLETVAKQNRFSPIEKKTLKAEVEQPFSTLYFAFYADPAQKSAKKIPVAASLFFDDDTTRYYMQSAADPAYKKLPATLAILAESIKDAKSKNLKFFDFWGIAPENADKTHPWAGFTKFKKSFGGEERDYAGTYDLVEKPLKYRLYKILRRFNRFLRKLKR